MLVVMDDGDGASNSIADLLFHLCFTWPGWRRQVRGATGICIFSATRYAVIYVNEAETVL